MRPYFCRVRWKGIDEASSRKGKRGLEKHPLQEECHRTEAGRQLWSTRHWWQGYLPKWIAPRSKDTVLLRDCFEEEHTQLAQAYTGFTNGVAWRRAWRIAAVPLLPLQTHCSCSQGVAECAAFQAPTAPLPGEKHGGKTVVNKNPYVPRSARFGEPVKKSCTKYGVYLVLTIFSRSSLVLSFSSSLRLSRWEVAEPIR